MSVQILTDKETYQQVMYCSTTMWAFGPVFQAPDEAEDFIEWLGSDPRKLSDELLSDKYYEWLKEREIEEEENQLKNSYDRQIDADHRMDQARRLK